MKSLPVLIALSTVKHKLLILNSQQFIWENVNAYFDIIGDSNNMRLMFTSFTKVNINTSTKADLSISQDRERAKFAKLNIVLNIHYNF